MTETNTDQAVIPATVVKPELKMTAQEVYDQAVIYRGKADATIATVQQKIDELSGQQNELQKMRLMVLGQRALAIDIISKMTGAPVEGESTQATQETK